MKNTVKVTIFHLNGSNYEKKVYEQCFWDEDQAQAIRKSGLSNVDSLYVSVPYTVTDSLEIIKGKDYIMQGETELEIDNTSQRTQSESYKALCSCHKVFIISSVSLKNHGSKRMWHWELSGK